MRTGSRTVARAKRCWWRRSCRKPRQLQLGLLLQRWRAVPSLCGANPGQQFICCGLRSWFDLLHVRWPSRSRSCRQSGRSSPTSVRPTPRCRRFSQPRVIASARARHASGWSTRKPRRTTQAGADVSGIRRGRRAARPGFRNPLRVGLDRPLSVLTRTMASLRPSRGLRRGWTPATAGLFIRRRRSQLLIRG